jgi:hypothetical protein
MSHYANTPVRGLVPTADNALASTDASNLLRQRFREDPLTWKVTGLANPHAEGAAVRRSVLKFADGIALSVGLSVLAYQGRSTDSKAGRIVHRQYYAASDMDTDPARVRISSDVHLVTLIDVDFYLDLPRFLGKCPANYFLYTFDIVAPGGEILGDPYYFQDGKLTMESSGSQRWTHGLWNWNSDHIVVRDRRTWFKRHGFTTHYITYRVTKRAISTGRAIVLLQPMAFVSEPSFASLLGNTVLSKRSASAMAVSTGLGCSLQLSSKLVWKGNLGLPILALSGLCAYAIRRHLRPKALTGSRLNRVAPLVFTDPVTSRRLSCFTLYRHGLSYLSVAFEGETCASTFDNRLVAVARSSWENQSTKLTTPSLLTKIQVEAKALNDRLSKEISSLEKGQKTHLRDMDCLHARRIEEITMVDAVLLFAYIRALCPPPVCVVKPHPLRPINVGSFIFDREYTFDNENHGMSAFMPAFFGTAVVFAKTRENEIDTIAQRVEATRTYVTGLTPELETVVDLFTRKLLIPNSGARLAPEPVEAIYERQDSEAKKAKLLTAMEQNVFRPVDELVRAFQKVQAEHFSENKSARNITNYNQAVKLFGSMFAKPVDSLLRKTKIYSGGMVPRDVADRVAFICLDSHRVVLGDVFRLDGSVNHRCRAAYLRFMTNVYHQRFFAHVSNLLAILQGNTVVTQHGLKYKQGYTIGSGGPDTSVFGSILNILVHLTAACRYFGGLEEGWEWLVRRLAVQGDDSISSGLPASEIASAAADWGLTYKLEVVEKGDFGVNYLNRYYTNAVFNGDPNSASNPLRAVEKFHIVAKTDILDPVPIAIQKSLGYYYGDANTPVLGTIVRTILRAAEAARLPVQFDEQAIKLRPYVMRHIHDAMEASELQYPNVVDDDFTAWLINEFFLGVDFEPLLTWASLPLPSNKAEFKALLQAAPALGEPLVVTKFTRPFLLNGERIDANQPILPAPAPRPVERPLAVPGIDSDSEDKPPADKSPRQSRRPDRERREKPPKGAGSSQPKSKLPKPCPQSKSKRQTKDDAGAAKPRRPTRRGGAKVKAAKAAAAAKASTVRSSGTSTPSTGLEVSRSPTPTQVIRYPSGPGPSSPSLAPPLGSAPSPTKVASQPCTTSTQPTPPTTGRSPPSGRSQTLVNTHPSTDPSRTTASSTTVVKSHAPPRQTTPRATATSKRTQTRQPARRSPDTIPEPPSQRNLTSTHASQEHPGPGGPAPSTTAPKSTPQSRTLEPTPGATSSGPVMQAQTPPSVSSSSQTSSSSLPLNLTRSTLLPPLPRTTSLSSSASQTPVDPSSTPGKPLTKRRPSGLISTVLSEPSQASEQQPTGLPPPTSRTEGSSDSGTK